MDSLLGSRRLAVWCVVLSACSDLAGPSEPTIAAVSIAPASDTLCIGGFFGNGSVQLTALPRARDGSGMVLPEGTFQWSSSEPSVATVDSRGLVRARGPGLATITAARSGVKGHAAIRVADCSAFSCPLVYSWDGSGWRLDSGTFGGAIMRALQRTDVDNLDHLVATDGKLRLRVSNELRETDHVDRLQLLVVDHPAGTRVVPDHRGALHVVRRPAPPVAAQDFDGQDVLQSVRSADGQGWESRRILRDPSRSARDGLVLRFVRPAGASAVHLLLEGNNTPWSAALMGEWVAARGAGVEAWYDSLNANPRLARALGQRVAQEAFLGVWLRVDSGWTRRGLFWEAGPEISKRQVMHLDLRGVRGDTVEVRLEAPPAFWWIDAVLLEAARYERIRVHRAPAMTGVAHDGIDPRAGLAATDDRYLTLEPGQWAELTFVAPATPAATERSYVLSSTGWYKIRTPMLASADAGLLAQVETEPGGLSRAATRKLNQAIRATGAWK
jgi:hypothetical protein